MDASISFFLENIAFGLVGLLLVVGGVIWIIYRSHQNYRQDIGEGEFEGDNDFAYYNENDPLIDSTIQASATANGDLKRAEAVFGDPDYLQTPQPEAVPELDQPVQIPATPEPAKPRYLIISLFVRAINEQGFSSQDILNSMQQLDLHYGSMQIFHYHGTNELDNTAQYESVFSVANMVEPGDFTNLNAPNFFSPGLVLFMQLPNQLSGRVAFELMFNHAQRLTTLLQAQLECDRHQRLDTVRIEEIRYNIDTFEAKTST